jgi:hypothetical protein
MMLFSKEPSYLSPINGSGNPRPLLSVFFSCGWLPTKGAGLRTVYLIEAFHTRLSALFVTRKRRIFSIFL